MRVRFAPSPDRRAAHRRRAHRALQLAAARGTTAGRSSCASRTPTASARPPRTSSRSSTRCAGSSSTTTRARSPRSRARDRHREVLAQLLDDGPRLPLDRDRPTTSRPTRTQHGADRGFRGEAEERGRGAPARARRGRDRRPRRHPRRHDVRATSTSTTRSSPAPTAASSTTSRSPSTTSTREITHVVRGEDHLSNTPKQLLVLEALGRRSRRSTRTCRCCTAPTARSSPSATARRRCRSCATPATCPRRCATTSRCSAGATPTTRRSSRPTSSSSASTLERVSQQPGALRRAEAALAERPLPARAAARRAHRAPRGASPAASGLRAAVEISREKMQTLADFWPLAGLHLRRAGRRPGGAREVARRGRARARWRDARDGARGGRAVHRRRDRRPRSTGSSRRAAPSPSDVFQPVRVALAGTTVSPGHLRDARACSGATRRCARIDAALGATSQIDEIGAQPFVQSCR